MKKFVELEFFFVSGDVITISAKDIKYFQIKGIKKDIETITGQTDIYEIENAEGFIIEVSKEWIYNRSNFTPFEQNMDIIKNLTYKERIKDYEGLVGIALISIDREERVIGINGNEDIITVKEDGNIVTIEIK